MQSRFFVGLRNALLVSLVCWALIFGGVWMAWGQEAPRSVAQVQLEYDASLWRLTQAVEEIKVKLEAERKKLMSDPAYVEKQETVQRLKKELNALKGVK